VDAAQFQRIAKALADPRRFELLEAIAGEPEATCQWLCERFPVSQATISHHLKELATAGLVAARRDGQFVRYHAEPAVVAAYAAELRRRVPNGGRAPRRAPVND
jgi:ArsR family transcriptional regulator